MCVVVLVVFIDWQVQLQVQDDVSLAFASALPQSASGSLRQAASGTQLRLSASGSDDGRGAVTADLNANLKVETLRLF